MSVENCLVCASDEGVFLDVVEQPTLTTKALNCRLEKVSEERSIIWRLGRGLSRRGEGKRLARRRGRLLREAHCEKYNLYRYSFSVLVYGLFAVL